MTLKYQYNIPPNTISLMTVIGSTSWSLHREFVCLLSNTSDQFHFRRTVFSSHQRRHQRKISRSQTRPYRFVVCLTHRTGSVGLILVKVSTMRVLFYSPRPVHTDLNSTSEDRCIRSCHPPPLLDPSLVLFPPHSD